MNLTSLITLPARLGYEVARRTIDVAYGAGRMVGLFGDGEQPTAERQAPEPQRSRRPEQESPRRPKTARPKPARARSGSKAGAARSGAGARRGGGASRASAPRKRAEASQPAEAGADRPAPLGSRVPGAVESEEVTLIRRVEVEVLRDMDASEITVDVNPIGGVVRLSGRASGGDHVRELQRRALGVPGVKRVENELLLPDSPAPGPLHAERRTEDAEPLPTELADRGEGRQPAPLGAGDDPPGGRGDGRTIP
jgi:hypothetical protein